VAQIDCAQVGRHGSIGPPWAAHAKFASAIFRRRSVVETSNFGCRTRTKPSDSCEDI
jgi:hypothetical protein